MPDNNQLLEQMRKVVREENEPIKKDLATVKQDIGRVEQKVEAVHEFNKKAHDEIVGMIANSNDMNGKEQKLLETRIERIEKHLGLPHSNKPDLTGSPISCLLSLFLYCTTLPIYVNQNIQP